MFVLHVEGQATQLGKMVHIPPSSHAFPHHKQSPFPDFFGAWFCQVCCKITAQKSVFGLFVAGSLLLHASVFPKSLCFIIMSYCCMHATILGEWVGEKNKDAQTAMAT